MKKNNLIALIAAFTVLMAALFVLINQNQPQQKLIDSQPLFAEIKPEDIAYIRIKSGGDTTTLAKGTDNYLVKEKQDYPANFQQAKRSLIDILQLKSISIVTKNPQRLERLGLEPTNPDRITVTLLSSQQAVLAEISFGRERQSSSGAPPNPMMPPPASGQFVKLASGPEVYLIPAAPSLEAVATRWLDKGLLKIDKSMVMALAITHAKAADNISLRNLGDDNFELSGKTPSGKALKAGVANNLANALKYFDLKDVLAADAASIKNADFDVELVVTLKDNRIYTLKSASHNGKHYAQITVAIATPATPAADAADAAEGSVPTPDLSADVAKEQALFSGRVFEIPTGDKLRKQRSEIFEDIAKDTK